MRKSAALSTLCYMEKDGKYLMLHRTVKKNDVNKDKWIGVGGHFEADESPEECLLREVREETGYRLTSWRFRGIVTFVSGDGVTEYMHLFTADGFEGEPIACDEGQLEWVDIARVWKLNIWEGDKIFFRLIDENVPFFSLKLVYNGSGGLVSAVLNGEPMELFDILNEDGTRTGIVPGSSGGRSKHLRTRGKDHLLMPLLKRKRRQALKRKRRQALKREMRQALKRKSAGRCCCRNAVRSRIPIPAVMIFPPQATFRAGILLLRARCGN